METRISVIIPTYRRPTLLARCIESLTGQLFDKNAYEIIVVSDGPDKETARIVQKWKTHSYPRILYYTLPVKKGPAAARNMGWRKANGRLIAFTDDDCIPSRDWLQSIWEEYRGEEDMAFAGEIIVPLPKRPTDYEWNISLLENASFATANCACTKKALTKVHGFDENFTLAWREDSDLEFKLLLHDIPIHHLQHAIVIHPARQTRWGACITDQKKSMFNALLYKKYPELYRQKIQARPPWHYYIMIILFLLIIAGLISHSLPLTEIALISWIFLVIRFARKRLSATSRAFKHILEITFTSMIIPFISVYWRVYGACRYKVLFF